MNNKMLHTVSFILLIAGGLNWLLVGAFKMDLVASIFGGYASIVYILVGLSAIYILLTHKGTCSACKGM